MYHKKPKSKKPTYSANNATLITPEKKSQLANGDNAHSKKISKKRKTRSQLAKIETEVTKKQNGAAILTIDSSEDEEEREPEKKVELEKNEVAQRRKKVRFELSEELPKQKGGQLSTKEPENTLIPTSESKKKSAEVSPLPIASQTISQPSPHLLENNREEVFNAIYNTIQNVISKHRTNLPPFETPHLIHEIINRLLLVKFRGMPGIYFKDIAMTLFGENDLTEYMSSIFIEAFRKTGFFKTENNRLYFTDNVKIPEFTFLPEKLQNQPEQLRYSQPTQKDSFSLAIPSKAITLRRETQGLPIKYYNLAFYLASPEIENVLSILELPANNMEEKQQPKLIRLVVAETALNKIPKQSPQSEEEYKVSLPTKEWKKIFEIHGLVAQQSQQSQPCHYQPTQQSQQTQLTHYSPVEQSQQPQQAQASELFSCIIPSYRYLGKMDYPELKETYSCIMLDSQNLKPNNLLPDTTEQVAPAKTFLLHRPRFMIYKGQNTVLFYVRDQACVKLPNGSYRVTLHRSCWELITSKVLQPKQQQLTTISRKEEVTASVLQFRNLIAQATPEIQQFIKTEINEEFALQEKFALEEKVARLENELQHEKEKQRTQLSAQGEVKPNNSYPVVQSCYPLFPYNLIQNLSLQYPFPIPGQQSRGFNYPLPQTAQTASSQLPDTDAHDYQLVQQSLSPPGIVIPEAQRPIKYAPLLSRSGAFSVVQPQAPQSGVSQSQDQTVTTVFSSKT